MGSPCDKVDPFSFHLIYVLKRKRISQYVKDRARLYKEKILVYEADWGEPWFEISPAIHAIGRLFTAEIWKGKLYKWLSLQYSKLGDFSEILSPKLVLISEIYVTLVEHLVEVRKVDKDQAWDDMCQILLEYFIDIGEERTIKEFIKILDEDERAKGLHYSGAER